MNGRTLADPPGSRDESPRGWVAIDAAFRASPTGIGTYSRRLIEELRAGPFGERLLLLAPEAGASHTLWLLGQVGPEIRQKGAALYHGLANFDLPLEKPAGVRFVLTVHDLIPLEWPDSVSTAFRLQFRAWLRHGLELADAVICPTAAVAETVRNTFPSSGATNGSRMHVIWEGVDSQAPLASSPPKIQNRPRYFLALGSVEIRKNLAVLLGAFESQRARWREAGIELWIAGQVGFGGNSVLEAIGRLGGAGVRYLGPQSPPAVVKLMRGALALCAPSYAEGFGLPPLEAMGLGIPVLASDIPAHREVLSDAAMLLPSDDADAWSSAMLQLATDGGLWAQRSRLGATRAAQFTWARTARETEAVYREVLARSSGGLSALDRDSTLR